MKRLLMCAILLFSLNAVKANSLFIPDSSRTSLQSAGVHDTIMVPILNAAPINSYQGSIYKRRLDSIKKDVPLDYNEYVQSYIDTYLNYNQRDDIGRVLGLTKYYFPIYEKAFHDAGIPEEIKYLSIVESQLNPYAVSRVGATGPWQFMTTTAKSYGLNMDNYVDERRDPIQSSYAAAAYLKDAYQEFGDWLLAIASYNCGKSNVIRALEKANGATDFWSIRQYLPAETRGYVPAYIAMTYVMNYYKKHNIVEQGCNMSMKTDTVLVNKYVSLNSVSKVLGINLSQLTILNPSYKMMIINGSPASPKRMVIPQASKEKYSALYDALNADMTYNRKRHNMPLYVSDKLIKAHHQESKPEAGYITYKVHRGDTLVVIANKFDGSSAGEIKELNGLKGSHLQPGMTLKISKI
ncbi:transglycosylase SLT domain-containing protein [Mucilaginibacter sp. McL0603]|uniref:lytic transglycosylase domain-containing protein n=1 Tax=Mucilaginibacter sp. McL0603 TaxID=3415670 RepID=UPI003CEFE953